MELDLFTFIAQVINFSILVFLLNKFLFKRISKAMDERKAKMASELSRLEGLNRQAAELLENNREINEGLKKSAASMLDNARAAAEKEKEGMMSRYGAEALSARQSWYRSLELEKQAFLDGLKERSAYFAFELAQKAVHDLADEESSVRIAETFIKKIRATGSSKAAEISVKISKSTLPLKVESSFEISENLGNFIISALDESLGYKGKIIFVINDQVCGIEITIDGYKISWSIREYLKDFTDNLESVWNEKKAVNKEYGGEQNGQSA